MSMCVTLAIFFTYVITRSGIFPLPKENSLKTAEKCKIDQELQTTTNTNILTHVTKNKVNLHSVLVHM